ncbi:hypothetical protein BJF88_14800 [Cellulosimicrobium sp. CUA-896]|nr:hypothetical protein BJF88_14800 [Cellulosimicrobium sp. CUA-896]
MLGALVAVPTVAVCLVLMLLTGAVVAVAAAGTWAWRTLSPRTRARASRRHGRPTARPAARLDPGDRTPPASPQAACLRTIQPGMF